MANSSVLDRWRANPIAFIEEVLHDPETGKPFVLLDAERDFLLYAFQTDDDGRLRYPELIFGAPKKSGKTGFAALIVLTMILLFGGRFAEGYALANDLEQASSRVFQAIKRIVEASPLLMREAKITADKIVFPAFFSATISAITSEPRLLAPIRRSVRSMSCGDSRPSDRTGCGMRWCRRQHARSPVDW